MIVVHVFSPRSRTFRVWTAPPTFDTFDTKSHRQFFSACSHMRRVGPERLFEYTSGRWLYNERLRLLERSLHFNVDALRKTVAACLHRSVSDVKDVSKVAEGGFNRVFEISMADGKTVLARLPYPSTRPCRYTVASEVATLNLLQLHGLPVPKVLRYSIDPENDVGAEYMILERLPGRPLADKWYDLTETERLKIIAQVVQFESKLAEIDFPAYGSIYHSHDLPRDTVRIAISRFKEHEDFCIGPSTAMRWWYGEREDMNIKRGPFSAPVDLLRGLAEKELLWLKAFGHSRHAFERAYRESFGYQKSSPEKYADSLEKFAQIAPYLVPHKAKLHRPILRHPDLQPNNIFCTDDLEIVGLIDWQHSNVLPQFLAAGIPSYFANYHDEESLRFTPPKMPSNFIDLSDEEQSEALEVYRRRHLHFFYLGFTQRFNPSHFEALSRRTDILTRKAFDHAGQPWEGNNVPLRSDLIHITKVWQELTAENGHDDPDKSDVPVCPVTFDREDSIRTLNQLKDQEETDTQLNCIREMIGIGTDGWTSNDMYDGVVERARLIKEQALQNLDSEEEREMTSRHWPFDDFDENE